MPPRLIARVYAMRGDTLIVFARAPRLGAVKRRLAREIGDRRGAALPSSRQLIAAAARTGRRPALATGARGHARPRPLRLPVGVPRIPQGGGDLGAAHASGVPRFRACRVALVGSDIPEPARPMCAAAFRALGRADAVFGPAADGGYWLVALGPRRPARPFATVRWSTEHALADTLANFAGTASLLRTLRDVDTAADLRRLRIQENDR